MLSIEKAFKQVERFQKAHKGLEKVPFVVVDTQENAFPNASEEWHKENTITGAYLPADNVVVVIANNNRDMEELNKTLRHEVFGHLALNRLNEFDKMDLLESIENAPKNSEVGIHRDMLLANEYSNLKNDPLRLAEEVYAHTAERSFDTIDNFLSVPDPKNITTEKDLLSFISSLKNGIHHGVLEQKIYPKDNSAQFKIKKKEIGMNTEKVNKEWENELLELEKTGDANQLMVFHNQEDFWKDNRHEQLEKEANNHQENIGINSSSRPKYVQDMIEKKDWSGLKDLGFDKLAKEQKNIEDAKQNNKKATIDQAHSYQINSAKIVKVSKDTMDERKVTFASVDEAEKYMYMSGAAHNLPKETQKKLAKLYEPEKEKEYALNNKKHEPTQAWNEAKRNKVLEQLKNQADKTKSQGKER